MPFGFDLLEKVRDAIGLERLYHGLISHKLICYHHADDGTAGGISPDYWDTIEGRNTLSSHGIINVFGQRSIVIVSIPHNLIEALRAESAPTAGEGGAEPEPTEEAGKLKPMRARDIEEAVAALKNETLAKRLTRPQASEFLRQRFLGRHITEANFRSIFRRVPTNTGRPRKADKEL